MYTTSSVSDRIKQVIDSHQVLYLYGDLAYGTAFGIISLFKHQGGWFMLSKAKCKANCRLSSVRIAVKHAFGHVAVN
jgi:hypothetical protein